MDDLMADESTDNLMWKNLIENWKRKLEKKVYFQTGEQRLKDLLIPSTCESGLIYDVIPNALPKKNRCFVMTGVETKKPEAIAMFGPADIAEEICENFDTLLKKFAILKLSEI